MKLTRHGVVNNLDKHNECLRVLAIPDITVVGWDTETTGLHIICDSPFIFVIGLYSKAEGLHTFVLDVVLHEKSSRILIAAFLEAARRAKHTLAHNIKFDMHMTENIGFDPKLPNLTDTITCIRLAHDNIQVEKGGPPIKLKDYCAKYTDPLAKNYDREIQTVRSGIAKRCNTLLQIALNETGVSPVGHKSWTIKALDELFKDPLFTVDDLHDQRLIDVYNAWYNELPMGIRYAMTTGYVEKDDVPYDLVPRDILYQYAEYDVILLFQVFEKTYPVISARGNMEALALERELIIPLYAMERVGFAHNMDYILEAKARMATYLRRQRDKLDDYMPGITVGQHACIKAYFAQQGVPMESSNAEALNKLIRHENPAVAIPAALIIELRTLAKWYTTYIIRIERQAQRSDRLYTQLNQNGAVSGRLSSDFQQFPKYPILDDEGNELFHPRRIIRATGGEYPEIFYLDYSQVELRVQALYTILLGTPDTNLCRAYMPYKCLRKDGTYFDIFDETILAQWDSGDWYLEEDPDTLWSPTDLHSVTTKMAYGIDESDPRFKKLRSDGKRVNFAKNYGAQLSKIQEMFPDLSLEQQIALNEAYYKAFPSVKLYHNYCYAIANTRPYVTNLWGVRYWGVSGHNLINMLVQGSSAYYLKKKIIELYDYLKDKKTRMQMNIHDEISYERHIDDGIEVIQECQRIQSSWPGAHIPFVSDAEVTTTTWAEKKEIDLASYSR